MKKSDKKKNNITVQDIAKVINISASSVSRALNNHPKISIKTKEKVWAAAKNLGYQRNLPAYMNPDKTKIICFMVSELNTPFYRDTLVSIQDFFKNKGYNLYIAFTNNSLDIEKMYSDSLVDLNVKGVIVDQFHKSSDISHLNQFSNNNIPTVFINKSNYTPNSCKIIPDFSHGAYKAINHFLSMKCKEIALFIGDLDNPFFADIAEGYKDSLTEAGLKINENHIFTSTLKQEDINKRLDFLFKNSKLPDAILAPNIIVSNHILNWLNKNNMNVPNHILLVSFSNDKNKSTSATTLSSIQFSGSEIGEKAAEMLFQQIKKGEIIDETIIIPAKFIIKSSSLKYK